MQMPTLVAENIVTFFHEQFLCLFVCFFFGDGLAKYAKILCPRLWSTVVDAYMLHTITMANIYAFADWHERNRRADSLRGSVFQQKRIRTQHAFCLRRSFTGAAFCSRKRHRSSVSIAIICTVRAQSINSWMISVHVLATPTSKLYTPRR